MIRINLLPVRQIKKRIKLQNEVLALVGFFILILAAMGVVGNSQAKKIEGLKGSISQLENEKNRYKKTIKQIEAIKKEQKILETKMQVIRDLEVYSQLPVRLLDEIANLTPGNRVWINSLSLSANKIRLVAVAMDNATIAQYMKKLSSSIYFSGAELQSSSMTKVANQNLKSFSLTVSVVELAQGVAADSQAK